MGPAPPRTLYCMRILIEVVGQNVICCIRRAAAAITDFKASG